MSSVKQKPFAVGDVVFDKQSGKVGTVKAVEDFRKGYDNSVDKQVVVLSLGSSPKDYVALEVPRLLRGKDGPLTRLGTPPRLLMGDEVLHNGQRWRVHEVLPHGAVKVGTTSGSMTLQWPTYRKAKKDKGGLGKFRRGDLVRVVGEPEYAWKAVVGIEREGDRTALRIDNGLRLHPSLFSRLERKEKPPLIPTSEAAVKAAQSFLEKPVSHAGVKSLENVFDLVKRFHAEKDPNQASFLVGKVIEGVINLNPAIRVDALVTTYDRRFIAEAKEKVNAHS
jgi:hypothetical protein